MLPGVGPKDPGRQGTHARELVRAVRLLYVPAGHWVHGYEVAPTVELYVPAGHALHGIGFATVETPIV